MRYFIGYLMQGDAAAAHSALAKDISERFGTWKLHENIPPHVTIFRPFETDDAAPIKKLLKAWVQQKNLSGSLSIGGFDHFDDKVVFFKTDPDTEARTAVRGLREKIAQLPGMPEEDFPVWNPHSTLAFKLSSDEINAIWKYVSTLTSPHFSLPFDNVTLFRSEGDRTWVVDEVFK